MRTITLLCSALLFSAAAGPIVPVTNFDLGRYLGTWYEIARMPAWFEKGLDSVTADYSLRGDGMVRVVNAGSRKGGRSRSVGRAKFAGRADIGALRVSFFGPLFGDYTIIELDTAQYRYAMVASGNRHLWILSRTPVLDAQVVHRLVGRVGELGFDTGRLYYTRQ